MTGHVAQPRTMGGDGVLGRIHERTARIGYLAHVIACVDDDQDRAHQTLRNAAGALSVLAGYLEQAMRAACSDDDEEDGATPGEQPLPSWPTQPWRQGPGYTGPPQPWAR